MSQKAAKRPFLRVFDTKDWEYFLLITIFVQVFIVSPLRMMLTAIFQVLLPFLFLLLMHRLVQWMADHSSTVHVNPTGVFCLNGGLSKEVFEPKVKICFMRNIFVLAKVAVKLLVLM